jgi:hypothetical protein
VYDYAGDFDHFTGQPIPSMGWLPLAGGGRGMAAVVGRPLMMVQPAGGARGGAPPAAAADEEQGADDTLDIPYY